MSDELVKSHIEWLRGDHEGCNPFLADRIEAIESRAAKAEAEVLRLRDALEDLRKSAALLQQNAEGCAVNHYGEDFAIHGLPGWLADTQASISRAAALSYGGDDAA